MQTKNQKAFTMIEVVFVIVVIGILAAVALPRFGESADSAYITKAQSTLATVRAALATERQRRILRGKAAEGIVDLGGGANAFSNFSAELDGTVTPVLDYPIVNCGTSGKGCWKRTGATAYSYFFPKASK